MKKNLLKFMSALVALSTMLSGASVFAEEPIKPEIPQPYMIGDTVSYWLHNDDFEGYTGTAYQNSTYFGQIPKNYTNADETVWRTNEFAAAPDGDKGTSLHINGVYNTSDKSSENTIMYTNTNETDTAYTNDYSKFTDFGKLNSDRIVISMDIRKTESTLSPDFYIRSKGGKEIAKFWFHTNGALHYVDNGKTTYKSLVNKSMWHNIKLIYDKTDYTVEYYVDGNFVAKAQPSATLKAQLEADPNYGQLRLTNSWGNNTKYECYLDNYKVGYADSQLSMCDTIAEFSPRTQTGLSDIQLPSGMTATQLITNYGGAGKKYLLSADIAINYNAYEVEGNEPKKVSVSVRGTDGNWLVAGLIQNTNGDYTIWKDKNIEGANGTFRNFASAPCAKRIR